MSSEVISPDHAKVLLTEIEKKDPQLYLACLTQYYCFLRPGKELRLLRVKDIDFNNGLIRVPQERAKNGHARTVTMPNHLLAEYMNQKVDKYDGELFVFGKRKKPDLRPVSINMLRYRFNKYRDKNGMPQKYHFYSWKHRGSSVLHDSRTVSMRELMDQLGHTKLSSTEHYLKKLSTGVNTRIKESFPAPY
jgi:integrase